MCYHISLHCLVCPEFQCKGYTSSTYEWEQHMLYIDRLQKQYAFPKEVKELFYELAQRGYCVTSSKGRIEKVMQVLNYEHYSYRQFSGGSYAEIKKEIAIQ